MSVGLFILSILPVFLIGWYIYKKDKDKENSQLLVKLFFMGVFSCIPAALIGLIFSRFLPEIEYMNFYQLLFYSFIVVALVEETCKWFFVYKIAYNHDEFDTIYDMIVYASFTALGFACFENIIYVYSGGLITGIARAISAVPGHVCNGILMGSYLGFSKASLVKGDIKTSKKHKILSLVIPTIIHGIYDFCLFYGNYLFIGIFVVFVIVLYIYCVKEVKKISYNNVKFKYKDNYCSNCGRVVNSNFCPGCGKKNN